MIYYPLSVLMNAGIRDTLAVSIPNDTPRSEALLSDGHQFGIELNYAIQSSPDGLVQAFIIGKEFIGGDSVAMVLGDNIFHGQGLTKRLHTAASKKKDATIFGYYVGNPERFGIVEFDGGDRATSIEERLKKPKSNYYATGLYSHNNRVVEYTKNLKPLARDELEITDLSRIYLEKGEPDMILLGQGPTWLDTGAHESLVEAANLIKTVETHQRRKTACLEEITYLRGWITREQVMEAYKVLRKNQCDKYLRDVPDGKYMDKIHPQDF